MLRKASHTILSVLLLTATIGLAISKHYCGGELVSTKIFAEADSCCDSGDCCQNETETYQLDEDFSVSAVTEIPESAQFENLLTEIWQFRRLSCPKRSTIGAYLLKTLEKSWQSYVEFHLNKLGCHFCRANLEDMELKTRENQNDSFRKRIMESTVGFLHKP